MRFAIIGVGNIAPIHAAAIRGVPGGELVAVATRRRGAGPRVCRPARRDLGTPTTRSSWRRRSPTSSPICTPPRPAPAHDPRGRAGGRACDLRKADGAQRAEMRRDDRRLRAGRRHAGRSRSRAASSRFRSGSRTRWTPDVSAGCCGPARTRSGTAPTRTTSSGPWRGTWAHEGGGVLMNQAIHAIDLLIWLTGLPERVIARTRTLNHQIEVEDAALAILEYGRRRGSGLIQATTIAHPGYPERLEFFGTNGSVVYQQGPSAARLAARRPAGGPHRGGRGQQRRRPAHGHHRGGPHRTLQRLRRRDPLGRPAPRGRPRGAAQRRPRRSHLPVSRVRTSAVRGSSDAARREIAGSRAARLSASGCGMNSPEMKPP